MTDYNQEYFLSHHVSGRVRLRARPDPADDSPLGQISRALRMEIEYVGEIADIAPDAVWLNTRPVYVVARDPRGGTPFMGKVESLERITYERIVRVLAP